MQEIEGDCEQHQAGVGESGCEDGMEKVEVGHRNYEKTKMYRSDFLESFWNKHFSLFCHHVLTNQSKAAALMNKTMRGKAQYSRQLSLTAAKGKLRWLILPRS